VLASTDDQKRGLDDSRRYDCVAVQHEHDLLIRIIDAAEDGKSQFVRISMFAYPTIVLTVSLGVLVLLCISVVPMFVNIFNDFGLVLPIPTRLVFLLSTWLTSGPEVIVTSTLAAALFGSILFWLTRRASKRLDIADILAKGKTSDLLAMSQLTKRLAQSLETESVGDSIRMAATGCINPRYQQPLEILAVEADSRLSTLHQSADAIQFPENVIEALKLGGNTSSDRSNQPAIALLNTLSAMYEERALGRVAVGATLAGLVSTLFVGGIVAFIILSLFLPLMNLIAGLA
jgi:type IV pilus assembly protein PilC